MIEGQANETVLETKRLRIHVWKQTDMDDASKLWGDREVMKFIDLRGGLSQVQVEEKLQKELHNLEHYRIQYWKVSNRHNGEFVGCCGLRPYIKSNLDPQSVRYEVLEIGFHIVSSQWGKGYASEAAQGVVGYAFETMKVQRLFAGHHPHNVTSRRVLEKLGFEYIGDEYYEPTGLNHPSYQLLNPKVKNINPCSQLLL